MNNREYIDLSSFEMEAMVLMVESSLKVYRRFQFFLWSQGGLHRFLPHETLLCAWGDVVANRYQYEIFTQNPAHERAIRRLVDSTDGLFSKMVGEWRRRGGTPCFLQQAEKEDRSDPVSEWMQRHDLGHALAHGAKEMKGDNGSFFLFVNLPREPTGRDAYMAELLMPHMHMALYRMVTTEADNGTPVVNAESVLSNREQEVLRWVHDGKTNHEIAQILNLSPLTVKNHVQKILRKLNATNRAQAVAKGIGSNLFGGADVAMPQMGGAS